MARYSGQGTRNYVEGDKAQVAKNKAHKRNIALAAVAAEAFNEVARNDPNRAGSYNHRQRAPISLSKTTIERRPLNKEKLK